MAKTQAECDMNNPEEFAAWAFAAGIPDPRSGREVGGKVVEYPHQPLIPPASFAALSKMLWELGFRHHAELQTKWVKPRPSHIAGNFEAWGLTEEKPDLEALAAQMVAEEFPDVAYNLSKVTPETHKEALREQAEKLKDSLRRLREAATDDRIKQAAKELDEQVD